MRRFDQERVALVLADRESLNAELVGRRLAAVHPDRAQLIVLLVPQQHALGPLDEFHAVGVVLTRRRGPRVAILVRRDRLVETLHEREGAFVQLGEVLSLRPWNVLAVHRPRAAAAVPRASEIRDAVYDC